MSASPRKKIRNTRKSDRSRNDAAQRKIRNPGRFQTLPPELLSEIFLIASHNYLEYEMDECLMPDLNQQQPCTLTRVCKFWRRVALSTPTLWAHIPVHIGLEDYDFNDSTLCLLDKHHIMVSSWLKLSSNSPLYIDLSIKDHAEFPTDLRDSMDRWHGIRIYDCTTLGSDFIPSLLDETLPNEAKHLRQIAFSSVYRDYPNICLSEFPNLKHLSGPINILPGPKALFQLKTLQANWSHLDSRRILALLPSLTTLQVYIEGDEVESEPPSTIITRKEGTSQIQDLNFEGDTRGLVSILACTALPVVCNADFSITGFQPDAQGSESALLECLSDFFQECSSTLTRLNLDISFDHYAHSMIETLYYATSITHLTLHLQVITDESLQALEWCNSRENNLCPRLAFFTFYFSGGFYPLYGTGSYFSDPPGIHSHISLKQLVRTVQSRVEKNDAVKVEIFYSVVNKAATKLLCDSDELRVLQDHGALKLYMLGWF